MTINAAVLARLQSYQTIPQSRQPCLEKNAHNSDYHTDHDQHRYMTYITKLTITVM